MAGVNWYGDSVTGKAKRGAADGLYEAAEFVLEQANRTVPIEEGILSDSGFTDIDRDKLEASVYYEESYAKRQHENLSYRHDPGRRAKWLELTVAEQRDRINQHIANRIREALK